MQAKKLEVAFFCMEFALENDIPNYAGGLGVLGADILLSCADLGVSACGISLLYHKDDNPDKAFDPSPFMKKRAETVEITIEDRTVKIAIWQMDLKGRQGHIVPVYFLSTYLPDNPRWDRDLTKFIYAGDSYTRLGQEAVLGIGGVRALEVLGYEQIDCYHMNEGHSALLTLELLKKYSHDKEKVKSLCTFTTHTPIKAGHDYFDYDLVHKTLPGVLPSDIQKFTTKDRLGMTQLALSLSKKANSVSWRHNEVCREMFPHRSFENVTNGIYHLRWVGEHIKKLWQKTSPDWDLFTGNWVDLVSKIDKKELYQAHQNEKKDFIQYLNHQPDLFPYGEIREDDYFEEDVLIIGFARRFVPYKRPGLIFYDLDRLRKIGYKKMQLVFASHCYTGDNFCLDLKIRLREYAQILRGQIRIAVLPDYNLNIAKRMLTGCDVWLNNPLPPQEASGTSGMKGALNGLLNFSVLDGWWIEGFQKYPQSGWAFGAYASGKKLSNRTPSDNHELLVKLEEMVNCYYQRPLEWQQRMKKALLSVSFFNTHRVVKEYQRKIWQA